MKDKKCNIVAAIHAGWKGTAANIVKETINTMIKEFNINPQNLLAAIAPSIGKCCYEVDFNVAQHFLEYEDAFTKNKNKYMLDLPHINLQQLLKMGLKIENIEQSNICTSCNVHIFRGHSIHLHRGLRNGATPTSIVTIY